MKGEEKKKSSMLTMLRKKALTYEKQEHGIQVIEK
jgi:hypothetical protein